MKLQNQFGKIQDGGEGFNRNLVTLGVLVVIFLAFGAVLVLHNAKEKKPQSGYDPKSEPIVSFDSSISISDALTLAVKEKIVVQSKGERIVHGFLRGIDKNQVAGAEQKSKLAFKVTKLSVDGVDQTPTPWDGKDTITLPIGNSNLNLPSGVHTFEAEYEVTGAIRSDSGMMVLDWDPIGHYEQVINRINIELHLPLYAVPTKTMATSKHVEIPQDLNGKQPIQIDVLTDPDSYKDAERSLIRFSSHAILTPPQDLRIYVTWPPVLH